VLTLPGWSSTIDFIDRRFTCHGTSSACRFSCKFAPLTARFFTAMQSLPMVH